MGSTFSSVVVSGDSRESIAAHVERWIVEGPWQASDGSSGGREILVKGPHEGWVGVYDDFLDGSSDFGALEDCAQRVGGSGIALASTVAHSDSFMATLVVRGEIVGRIVHDPGDDVWEGRWARSDDAPARWAAAIGRPDVAQRIADILGADYTFADDRLGDIALSLGLPDSYVLSGLESARASVGFAAITLAFETTQHEEPAVGPSRLESAGHSTWPSIAVGAAWTVSVSALSMGGPGSFIELSIWGPAIAEGLVEPTGTKLWTGMSADAAGAASETLDEATTEDGRVIGGAFDLVIPGRAVGLDMMGRGRGLAAWADSMIHVQIVGEARTPGRAPLYVALVPDGDREGVATLEIDVWVHDRRGAGSA